MTTKPIVGHNIPYRGIEDHGVPISKSINLDPDDSYWDESGESVVLNEVESLPDPIPVRIVHEGTREIRRFRIINTYVGLSSGILLNHDSSRISAKIKHLGAGGSADIWLSHEDVNSANYYPIAQTDLMPTTIPGSQAIFARAASGIADIPVSIIVEFATSIE